ncbi:MAG: tetratricopeptide repeat protein [Muribaculaceae bacterium]|nr:tetratricopeptide repeat protein [Muribaculaceae bacterium]
MRLRLVFFTLLAFVLGLTAIAEELEVEGIFEGMTVNTSQNKWASSKYFIKGLDAFDDVDMSLAVEMFEKELKQHPSNGYAMCNLALCRFTKAMYEKNAVKYNDESTEKQLEIARVNENKAKTAALTVLDNGIALLPSSDAEAQCQAYRLKADLLRHFEDIDSTQIAACYDKAIAVHPCEKVYEEHIDFFFNNTDVVIADAKALRKLNPDDLSIVKLLAVMSYRNEDYGQCLELCEEHNAMLNKAQGEDAIDAQVGTLQLASLKELGRENEAMDLALTFIADYEYTDAIQLFLEIAEKYPDLAEIKIKQRMFAESGEEMLWNFMLGRIMEIKKDYGTALEYFKTVEKANKEAFIYNEIANCYYMLGDTDNALLYIDAATIMDGGHNYLLARDKMLINLGKAKEIINEKMTRVELVKNINNVEFLQRLTLVDVLLQEHDYAQAVSILEPLLEMDEGASVLSLYATALKGLGRNDEAKRCLQQITEIDPLPTSEITELVPALFELGRGDEALNKANMLAQQWEDFQQNRIGNEEPETCYTIATVFAQIGESDKALEYLEKHFNFDYMPYDFGLIERDWRLDNLRELPQFKALVEKYKTLWKSNASSTN